MRSSEATPGFRYLRSSRSELTDPDVWSIQFWPKNGPFDPTLPRTDESQIGESISLQFTVSSAAKTKMCGT